MEIDINWGTAELYKKLLEYLLNGIHFRYTWQCQS